MDPWSNCILYSVLCVAAHGRPADPAPDDRRISKILGGFPVVKYPHGQFTRQLDQLNSLTIFVLESVQTVLSGADLYY